MKLQKGFYLIQLLVGISLFGITLSIAINAYINISHNFGNLSENKLRAEKIFSLLEVKIKQTKHFSEIKTFRLAEPNSLKLQDGSILDIFLRSDYRAASVSSILFVELKSNHLKKLSISKITNNTAHLCQIYQKHSPTDHWILSGKTNYLVSGILEPEEGHRCRYSSYILNFIPTKFNFFKSLAEPSDSFFEAYPVDDFNIYYLDKGGNFRVYSPTKAFNQPLEQGIKEISAQKVSDKIYKIQIKTKDETIFSRVLPIEKL